MQFIDPHKKRNRYQPKTSGIRVSLKARDRIWLQALAAHGPLDSRQLHSFSSDDKPSLKSSLKRLTDLTHETNTSHGSAYLCRPKGQLRHYKAKNRPAIYDLSPAAFEALGHEKPTLTRPTGPFEHQHMVASVSAAIDLTCQKINDRKFIPQQFILDRAGANLAVDLRILNPRTDQTERHRLIPDSIFAIEYLQNGVSKYRSFALECDRGTEPITSRSFARKSYYRSILQYEELLDNDIYKTAYGLKSPMSLLYVFTSQRRLDGFRKLLDKSSIQRRTQLAFFEPNRCLLDLSLS